MSNPFPGQSGGENAQLSVGEQAYRAAGSPEIPPGPVPQRMGSGDHLGPQFAGCCQVQDEPEIPAVHRNPTAYYGEDDDRFGGNDDAR
jgi:hypothetical protein